LEIFRTPPFCQQSDRLLELPTQSNFSAAMTRDVLRSKQAAMSFCPSVTKYDCASFGLMVTCTPSPSPVVSDTFSINSICEPS
jgi:hypothetical protein